MVVTRRAPAPPVPTSRTNSAQPIPRVKGKLEAPHTVPDVPSPLSNGTSRAGPIVEGSDPDPKNDSVAGKKGKGRLKGKHRKDRVVSEKQYTFKGLLTRILLLWFTIYVITVCPDDDRLQSPICHGLYTYRTHVLEPYIFPPIRSALSHPSVAPLVNRATPYISRAVAATKPYAVRAHHEWTTRVLPQWEKTVVPQWRKHVVPQWQRYAGPYIARIEQQAAPYIFKAQAEYERRLGPHLRVAGYKLHRWQQLARPYIVSAAHKTYDGYVRAKPYAIPVLQRSQASLVKLSKFLGEQRRLFVDPHVKKIWERVNELSTGETPPKARVGKHSTVSASISSPVSSSAAGHVSDSPSTASSSITPSLVPTPEVIVPVPTIDTSLAEALVSSAASVVSSVTETLASVASSVVLDGTSSSPASVPEKPIATRSPAVEDTLSSGRWASSQDRAASTAIQADSPEPSVTARVSTAAPGGTDDEILDAPPAAPAAAPSHGVDDTDADDFLEKFYAELGLDVDAEERAPESASESPAVETETEEEKAEKHRVQMEEIAKKRADITGRHRGWEEQMEDRIEANRKALRTSLVALRKAAVQELKESKEIRKEIEDLVDEAEKYLKGAEKYMGKLGEESRPDEEKSTIWSRVVEKVDQKFVERLSRAETVVNGWYLGVVEKEIQEVRRLAAEVRDIADRAQADVGLDYAYLEDVTYNDWQRYHDLERKSDNFTAHAFSVQNGTHPSPPVNPVLPAIQELQDEVQDIVVGFETRLRRIKRNGERAFSATVDDADAPKSHDTPSDETVSILPIEDDARKHPVDGESPAVPPVVIGRSKEEILSALGRAAEVEAQATSAPDDKHKEPEQVVESLAQEAVAEGSLAASPLHEEL